MNADRAIGIGAFVAAGMILAAFAAPVLILGFWDAAVWVGSGGGD
jgi:hypothetical protein